MMLSACAPLFRAVPLDGPTQTLPNGAVQGPFTLTVPFDNAAPHRLTVNLTARCQPQLRVELRTRTQVFTQTIGVDDAAWQAQLKQRFLAPPRPTDTAPTAVPTGAAAQINATPESVAGSVTLPGHWEATPSFWATFDAESARRCTTEQSYTTEFTHVFEAAERDATVVAWAEVPQLLSDAQLWVTVERLDPPEEPKEDHSHLPAAGATWRPGFFTWFNESDTHFGWRWTKGEWLAPATVPPQKLEAHDSPPNLGQVWVDGSWRWAGADGWQWTRGKWSVPDEPGPRPPQRKEVPVANPSCPAGQWKEGNWRWDSNDGWHWQPGRWAASSTPASAKPDAKAESPGEAPKAGQLWRTGDWSWDGCRGWVWVDGKWFVPHEAPGSPPAPRDEKPGWNLTCAAGVWASGSWHWAANEGWVWSSGKWVASATPTTAQPAPRVEAHGDPPHPGQLWLPGDWQWRGCEGWSWHDGRWTVPAKPQSDPPPLRDETVERAETEVPFGEWQAGRWVWGTQGWEWSRGFWQVPQKPNAPAPPLRDETAERIESEVRFAEWHDGHWAWGTQGWEWSRGFWQVPERPNAPPPPLLNETLSRPASTCRAATWVSGNWAWGKQGWAWENGHWSGVEVPTSTRPLPRLDRPTPPPTPTARWSPGAWAWAQCDGWQWVRGRWAEPPPPGTAVTELAPWPVKDCATTPTGAPPAARVDVAAPPSPAEGAVWLPGAWVWACEWTWRPGRWHQPPQPGMVWVPGPTVDLGRWTFAPIRH